MKNLITKLDKIIKSEESDPVLKKQAEKKREALTSNKPIEK